MGTYHSDTPDKRAIAAFNTVRNLVIYADFIEEPVFGELVKLLTEHFKNVTFGQQGDMWIWIESDGMKVEIDTFTAMYFQVKSPISSRSQLVHKVIELLQRHYKLFVYTEPELEAHE